MEQSVDRALKKAALAVQNGRHLEAEALCRAVLEKFPANKRARDLLVSIAPANDPPQADLLAAVALLRADAAGAAQRAGELLRDFPNSATLHTIMGAALAAQQRPEQALACYDEALRLQPDHVDALNNRANALLQLGRLDDALASYDRALEIDPEHAEVHNNRGNTLRALERLEEAVAAYDDAVRLRPDHAEAWRRRAFVLSRLWRLEEALASFDQALQLMPGDVDAHYGRGQVLQGLKRLDEALASYDEALRLQPDIAAINNSRGAVLARMQRREEAAASFERAVSLEPGYADARHNLGLVLHLLQRFDAAIASFDEAIRLDSEHVEALANRGNALRALKRMDEALASLEAALKVRPQNADALNDRGNVLHELKRLDEALAAYDEALKVNPDHPDAHSNRAVVLADMKRPDEAVASFERALRLKPNYAAAMNRMLYEKAKMCDWTAPLSADRLARLGVEGDAVPPFGLLALEDAPERQLQRSQNWARVQYAAPQAVRFERAGRPPKLRIGYFSADFHEHATMYLMARLFELHDKDRFEIHAFSYGADADDRMRRRLKSAVDGLHEVRALADQDIAALAREKQIDIAVDLKGYTEETRSGLFAYRAAPIQINYLGYPGSMGTPFMDYLIADEATIPEDARRFYSEQVIHLPDSYQPNDLRVASDRVFTRSELGLPEEAFVFCCFNNNFKVRPAEFDIWMRLLEKVEGSVLWLLKDNRWVEANLRKEAAARGVDPDRLVFAGRMPQAEHLARHRSADLFLDTFNYNAHTTASDALWMGLPVVTRRGRQFAARVGSSLLQAVGLPELVTEGDEAYEALALQLASEPVRLSAIKAKLAANRASAPLFDSGRYARQLEAAFDAVFARYLIGSGGSARSSS